MFQIIHGNIVTDTDVFPNISPVHYIPITRFIAKDIDRKTHIPDVESVAIVPSKEPVSRCYWLPTPHDRNRRYHVIKLHIGDTDPLTKILQWIQVFSHEYMHHAIDRKERQSDPHSLIWFDEALCHISSVCSAYEIFSSLLSNENTELHWLKPNISSLNRIIEFPAQVAKYSPVAKSIRDGKGICEFLPFPEDGLDLALGSVAIASCTHSLFHRNPNLWKIVPHVNEVSADADARVLFSHLKKTADSSYRHSLDELIGVLFP